MPLGYPVNHFFRRRYFIFIDAGPVVYQPQAGPALKWNHPEPVAVTAEMVGGQPCRDMPQLTPVLMEQHFLVGKVRQLLNIKESIRPKEHRAVADGIRFRQFQSAGKKFGPSAGINYPRGLDFGFSLAHFECHNMRR